ncbi:MAG: RtcB family protein [Arcobacter sp.]|nr:MAG: RtcB family protein [Arcobacter sp.]
MDLKKFGFYEINHKKFQETHTDYKIYAEVLDEISQEQFYEVLNQKFVTYAALMPDAHAGYSMPIGAVCSTKDAVIPAFVGFDIGCGMCAYKTDFYKKDIQENADLIYEKIIQEIPLGSKTHKNHQSLKLDLPLTDYAQYLLNTSGLKQLGTLGGGNHFIEIGYGKDDKVWIVIHSGSRGFGHKIASHYMIQAYLDKNKHEDKLKKIVEEYTQRNLQYKSNNPEAFQKSLLKVKHKNILELNKKIDIEKMEGTWELNPNSQLGKDYIKDQNFALEYALENRKKMINVIHNILNSTLNSNSKIDYEDEKKFINRNHNHVQFNESTKEWIHRKGATDAQKNMTGVIPGNMRDGSFIIIGKGCNDSLNSSSHGAGRVMSRKKAKTNINMQEFKDSMKGIKGTIDENTIDEAPFAYKDIFEVMKLQEDLVEIIDHVKVLINIKDNTGKKYKKS